MCWLEREIYRKTPRSNCLRGGINHQSINTKSLRSLRLSCLLPSFLLLSPSFFLLAGFTPLTPPPPSSILSLSLLLLSSVCLARPPSLDFLFPSLHPRLLFLSFLSLPSFVFPDPLSSPPSPSSSIIARRLMRCNHPWTSSLSPVACQPC